MKKVLSLVLALVLVLTMFAGCGDSSSDTPDTQNTQENNVPVVLEEVDWSSEGTMHINIATSSGEGTRYADAITGPCDWASELTDGKFSYTVGYSNSFVDEAGMMDAILGGMVQLGKETATVTSAVIPEIACLTYPGYYAGSAENYPAFLEEVHAVVNEIFADYGLYMVALNPTTVSCFMMKDTIVHGVDDLKGKIIRVSGASLATVMENWNASPTVIGLADCVTALDRGTVDGVYTGDAVINAFRMYEVADCCTWTTFCETSGGMMTSLEYWNSLSPAQQALFTEIGNRMDAQIFDLLPQLKSDYQAVMDEEGIEYYEMTVEECAALTEGVLPLFEEFGKNTSEKGLKLLEIIYRYNGWDWTF